MSAIADLYPRAADTYPRAALDEKARKRLLSEGAIPELGHLVMALCVGALIYGRVPAGWTVIWVSTIVAATIARAAARISLRRSADGRAAARRHVTMRGALIVLALAWGAGAGLFAARLPVEDVALILVVLSGLLAGALTTLAADRIGFRGHLAAMVVPLAAGVLASGLDRSHAIILLFIVLFVAFMLDAHRRAHAALIERIRTVTRLSRSEAGAARGQAEVDALFAGAPAAIVVVDADGVVKRVNPRFEDLFGYIAGEAVGRVLNDLIVPASEQADAEQLEKRAAGGEAVFREVKRMRQNGSLVPVRVSAARVADSTDLFVIYEDITAQVVARQALEDARDAAERASHAKSAFLANMSHELRTPLNSVIGFASVLHRNKNGRLAAQDLEYIQRIKDNGKHLLGLINSVLDLSKVEAGRMELTLEPVALEQLARQTLEELQSQVRDRPIELRVEAPERLALLVTDGVKLKQVLINLVGNAIKFTEHGSVTVRIATDPATGRPVRLDVTDTGPGIAPESQANVFEAFQQADNSISRRYGGTGLGLAITRALCQLMGAELTLASEVGVGSTFTIHFAAAPAEPVAVPEEVVPMLATGRRVLVIDDDGDARTLLQQLLHDAQCDVTMAASGAEGLRLARMVRPDLITLDLMMPLMSGYDVLDALRADPVLADIPVVIVSIVASDRRPHLVGAAALIDKPVSRAELEGVLRRYLAEPPGNKGMQFGDLLGHLFPVLADPPRRQEECAAAD